MRILITGATGMDGRHLASRLGARNLIWGMVRHPDHPKIAELSDFVQPIVGDLLDRGSLIAVLDEVDPDVIYHLGALSAPGVAWRQPELCGEVTGLGTLRLLEACYSNCAPGPEPTVIVAGSLAEHGPYGAAKTYARVIAADYRARGYPVTTIVMGGHHSPLRGATYLSQKVARHARSVADARASGESVRPIWGRFPARASGESVPKLSLGPLDRVQDWGWAPDFMEVWARAHHLVPDDYVLSTGDPRSAESWVAACYAAIQEDWSDHVTITPGGGNVTDVPTLTAQPDPRLEFGSSLSMEDIAERMVWA